MKDIEKAMISAPCKGDISLKTDPTAREILPFFATVLLSFSPNLTASRGSHVVSTKREGWNVYNGELYPLKCFAYRGSFCHIPGSTQWLSLPALNPWSIKPLQVSHLQEEDCEERYRKDHAQDWRKLMLLLKCGNCVQIKFNITPFIKTCPLKACPEEPSESWW
jgi:hypothetical protein